MNLEQSGKGAQRQIRKKETHRKTELLKSRFDERGVLKEDVLQISAAFLDISEYWKITKNKIGLPRTYQA